MNVVKQIKIQEHYDTIADVYDHHYDQRRGRSYHKHISTHIMNALPHGGKLLDIGCGTGLFVQRYIEAGGNAIGLDMQYGYSVHGCSNVKTFIYHGERPIRYALRYRYRNR